MRLASKEDAFENAIFVVSWELGRRACALLSSRPEGASLYEALAQVLGAPGELSWMSVPGGLTTKHSTSLLPIPSANLEVHIAYAVYR